VAEFFSKDNAILSLAQSLPKLIRPQQDRIPSAPGHLKVKTRRWFKSVVRSYYLEQHHVRLLIMACEAWDRNVEARERIAQDGAYVRDRWDCLKLHPAIAVERDSRIAFARLIRELRNHRGFIVALSGSRPRTGPARANSEPSGRANSTPTREAVNGSSVYFR